MLSGRCVLWKCLIIAYSRIIAKLYEVQLNSTLKNIFIQNFLLYCLENKCRLIIIYYVHLVYHLWFISHQSSYHLSIFYLSTYLSFIYQHLCIPSSPLPFLALTSFKFMYKSIYIGSIDKHIT